MDNTFKDDSHLNYNPLLSGERNQCKIPTEEDKNTLVESYSDSGIFSEEESKKIADMLLKINTVQQGGDCTPSTRIVARYIIVAMAALLIFIISQIVKMVRNVLKSNKEAIYQDLDDRATEISGQEVIKKFIDLNLLEGIKKGGDLLIKQAFGRNKEETIKILQDKGEYDKIEKYERGTFLDSIMPRLEGLKEGFYDIFKVAAGVCGTVLNKIFEEYYLNNVANFLKNIPTIFNKFCEVVIANFNLHQLLNISMEDIKNGFLKYMNNEQGILTDILIPLEDRICDMLNLILTKGGKFAKTKPKTKTKTKTKPKTKTKTKTKPKTKTKTKLHKKYSKRMKNN